MVVRPGVKVQATSAVVARSWQRRAIDHRRSVRRQHHGQHVQDLYLTANSTRNPKVAWHLFG
jgi:hypothetical protein